MGTAAQSRGDRVAMSARRLLIVLMNTDPRNPEELGAPFYYSAVAAAMDHPVYVLCTATAGKLMLKGVAAAITIKPDDPMTVYDWIKQAHGQGAKFWSFFSNDTATTKIYTLSLHDALPISIAAAMIQDVMGDD